MNSYYLMTELDTTGMVSHFGLSILGHIRAFTTHYQCNGVASYDLQANRIYFEEQTDFTQAELKLSTVFELKEYQNYPSTKGICITSKPFSTNAYATKPHNQIHPNPTVPALRRPTPMPTRRIRRHRLRRQRSRNARIRRRDRHVNRRGTRDYRHDRNARHAARRSRCWCWRRERR